MTAASLAAMLFRARDLDLSDHALQALCILSAGSLSLTDLASQIGISTAAITHIADRLESLSYAERTRPSSDRRVILLRLTETGNCALGDILSDGVKASWDFAPALSH